MFSPKGAKSLNTTPWTPPCGFSKRCANTAARLRIWGWSRELFDVLAAIVDWYAHGTRYAIRVDESDGLLHAGEPGLQLTWMDAKVGDQVITPRIGKPVEVNALWYNALRTMARFAFELNKPPQDYIHLAERVEKSFARFWNAEAGCCFDVFDGPRWQRCFGAAQSDFCGVAAGKSARARAAKSRGRFLRAPSGHASWTAHARSRRSAIRGSLRRPARRARRGLSSRNGLGLAAGAVCAGAFARLRRAAGSFQFSRTDGAARSGARARQRQRDF